MFRLILSFLFQLIAPSFAAGAGLGDLGVGEGGGEGAGGEGGEGGEGAGGEGGEGGEGDEGIVTGDIDDEEGAEGEGGEGEEGGEGKGGEGKGGEDLDKLVDIGDGRKAPAKIKKLFDLAKKAGVEKEAKQLFYANQRLTRALPGGVNEAIQLAKTVNELGGVEGIEQMQSDLALHTQDGELFKTDQKKWIETSFQENEDAALAAFSHSLDYVAEHHPDQYGYYMARVLMADLAENVDYRGIYEKLKGIQNDPKAAELAKALAEYVNDRNKKAQNVPKKEVDKNAEKVAAREKAVETREMNTRYSEVNRDANPVLKQGVIRSLRAEAKDRGLDLDKYAKENAGEWRDLLNDVHQRVMRAATKDSRFIDKYFALVKANDLRRATKAINEKHTAVIPDAVRAAIANRGAFRKKKAAGGAGGGQNAGDKGNKGGAQDQGWTSVASKPQNSAIDYAKTTRAMQLDGKYILKDGKKVKVKY